MEKVRDIVGFYLDPPERALVLCVDEKSQIQALDRSRPHSSHAAGPGRAASPRLHAPRHHHALARCGEHFDSAFGDEGLEPCFVSCDHNSVIMSQPFAQETGVRGGIRWASEATAAAVLSVVRDGGEPRDLWPELVGAHAPLDSCGFGGLLGEGNGHEGDDAGPCLPVRNSVRSRKPRIFPKISPPNRETPAFARVSSGSRRFATSYCLRSPASAPCRTLQLTRHVGADPHDQ